MELMVFVWMVVRAAIYIFAFGYIGYLIGRKVERGETPDWRRNKLV